MSTRFTVSVTAEEEGGPSFSATVVLCGGEVAVTSLSVRLGTNSELPPGELVTGELAALLSEVTASLTPTASSGKAAPALPSPPKNEPAPPPRRASGNTPQRANADGPPADLAKVYWRLRTIAKVAAHYKVEKHIARKWINQLSNRTQSFPNGKR